MTNTLFDYVAYCCAIYGIVRFCMDADAIYLPALRAWLDLGV